MREREFRTQGSTFCQMMNFLRYYRRLELPKPWSRTFTKCLSMSRDLRWIRINRVESVTSWENTSFSNNFRFDLKLKYSKFCEQLSSI